MSFRWPRLSAVLWSCVFLFVGPLLALPVIAFADEWRSPARLPQRFGFRAVRALLDDDLLRDAVVNSTLVATVASTIGLALAWPAARALRSAGATHWHAIPILAPVLLPPLVIGEGLRTWFLRIGIADGLAGIVLAHLVFVIPYMVLVLLPGFSDALLRREEAALVLGSTRWTVFVAVTLRILAGRVGVAVALGFTVSWSQYGTSLGIGGGTPMLPLVLVPFIRSDPQIAALLDLVLLMPPLALLAFGLRSGVDQTA